tara:strand:- start:1147 stop:1287 length:141 start_codon:yes stop_codon:yes gene_type:complete
MGDHLKATRKLLVDDVYIPVKRKKKFKSDKAESMIDEGQKTPIQVH